MRTGITMCAAIIATLSGTALGQAADWNNNLGGIWTDAANWNPMVVPNGTTFDVTLGLVGAYSVDLNTGPTIGSLSITNPLATLGIGASRTLTINPGPVFNDGTIVVNSTGSVFDSRILFTGPTSVLGSGEIVLGTLSETGSNADARIEANGAFTVTVGAEQTIRGNGEMRGAGTFNNLGTIIGDDPLGPGILIATTIDQTGGGAIDVTDGVVSLGNNALVTGGQITGTGSGAFRVPGSPGRMSDVTLNGPVEVLGGGDQLALVGPIVNNNTITLNSNGAVFNSALRFDIDTSVLGTGSIVMVTAGNQNDAAIQASAGFTGTLGVGQTVTGSGQINGSIVLEGSITATDDAQAMAVNDAVSGSGTLAAADACTLVFNTASIAGLTFDSSGSGIVAASVGETFLTDVIIIGSAGVAGNGARMTLLSDLTNNGSITLNYDERVFNALLDFDADASITGAGDIRMVTSGNVNDAQIVTSDSFVGTFGADQAIAGSGQFNGDFVNFGVINGDDPTAPLRILGSMGGPGTLRSDGGHLSLVAVALSDQSFATSSGGLVSAAGGLTVMDRCTNTGDLGIDGDGSRLQVASAFTNNGNVLVNANDAVFNAGFLVDTPDAIDGTGTFVLETANSLNDARIEAINAVSATFGPGQRVTGSGQLHGDLTFEGSVDPAGDFRELTIVNGAIKALGGATFDLGGLLPGEFDRITTGANVSVELGGTVEINLDPSYTPAFGDEWEIIGGSGTTTITGVYDSYILPPAPPTLNYRVFIEPDRVFVRLTCGADFNGDVGLNFFDISTYITLFNAGDPRADLAAPFGAINFFDIVTYINIYNSGCP